MKPGARPPLNEAYFRRMSAIEFAVKYDDGVGSGLSEADIVLVGVSRTSKTPLSIYLGYLGYKTANVPLVKGIEPPPELFTVDQSKVVGPDDRRTATVGDPRRAHSLDARRPQVREPRRDLRRARVRGPGAPAARLPGARGERALDRGDLAPDHPARRAACRRSSTHREAETTGSALALERLVHRARPRRSSSSTASSRRSGSACARSPGWRSSGHAAAARGRFPVPWPTASSTTSTSRPPVGGSCSAARGSGSRR